MNSEQRKAEHILLALKSQTASAFCDERFDYEPLLGRHPQLNDIAPISFLGYKLKAPLWISSMTGGTKEAGIINRHLAQVAREFGLGMGLGSMRRLLVDKSYFADFDLREVAGSEVPLFMNLGIGQIEEMVLSKSLERILVLSKELKSDGLIVHINPLQEWLQPEGDRFSRPPIEILNEFLPWAKEHNLAVIVKEVGQGMGPRSLKALLELPFCGLELAAFGGTNFSQVEWERRQDKKSFEVSSPLTRVGHTAEGMISSINDLVLERDLNKTFPMVIISGGIASSLDAYYYRSLLKTPSLYGQGSALLLRARSSYEDLYHYVKTELEQLALAEQFLVPRRREN